MYKDMLDEEGWIAKRDGVVPFRPNFLQVGISPALAGGTDTYCYFACFSGASGFSVIRYSPWLAVIYSVLLSA